MSTDEHPRWARNLERGPDGIWCALSSRGEPGSVSFPEDGHDACFLLEDDSFWFAHRNECIARALAQRAFSGPLLDVGGGNGAVSAALERRGVPTVLLEPRASGARNARRRGLTNVVCASLRQAAFEPGTFGAVGLFDVIEHLADPAALLADVRAVLRPSGVLCLTAPAYSLLWSAEDELAGHHRRYTLGQLVNVLREASFEIRYRTYLFAPLPLPIFLLRSLPHRFQRRSRATVERSSVHDHLPSRPSRRLAELLLAVERGAIRAGRSIPFGSSCLVVATALGAPPE